MSGRLPVVVSSAHPLHRWFACLCAGGVLGACEAAPPERSVAANDQPSAPPFAARFTVDGAYRLEPGLPLAHRRSFAPPALKGDAFDDRRSGDPENYAITAPPTAIADVRPMTEWEPMTALVLAYPSYAVLHQQASETLADVAKYASEHGEVWVLVSSQQAETFFTQNLVRRGIESEKLGTVVKFLKATFNTYWLLDYGPLPLIDEREGTYALADFRYHHDRPLDDAIPTLLGRELRGLGQPMPATTYRVPLDTEGGAFQATGDGVCITGSRQLYHMSCLAETCKASILDLSLPALQVHPYAVEMRRLLRAYLGCEDLVVTHSVAHDSTGHIDMYLKILDDDRILLGEFRAPLSTDFQRRSAGLMNDNAAFLEAYIKPSGGRFRVTRMPMPGDRIVEDGSGSYEVPFTYLNSTFFNGLNLWPAYNFTDWQASRAEADAIWHELMPDMAHVWIDAEELSYQSGAIHCVTRTIPAKTAQAWVGDGRCEDGLCVGSDDGYSGQCAVDGASDLCWGPEWLCACNDCRACPIEVPDTACGAVDWRGCCASGDLLFCDNAQLHRLPCAGTGCGWNDARGYYECGLSGEEPSGVSPSSCGCAPSCGGDTCGDDGCGGSCGSCDAGERCVLGACRAECADCPPGATGCEEATSWRCVEGPDACAGSTARRTGSPVMPANAR